VRRSGRDTAGQADQIARAQQGQRKAHRYLEHRRAAFKPKARAVRHHAQTACTEAHLGLTGGIAILLGISIAWGVAVPYLSAHIPQPADMEMIPFAMSLWKEKVRFKVICAPPRLRKDRRIPSAIGFTKVNSVQICR
jgi:hypothetical protein